MSSVNKILLWILKCYFMSYTVMYSFDEFESLKKWLVLPLPTCHFLTFAISDFLYALPSMPLYLLCFICDKVYLKCDGFLHGRRPLFPKRPSICWIRDTHSFRLTWSLILSLCLTRSLCLSESLFLIGIRVVFFLCLKYFSIPVSLVLALLRSLSLSLSLSLALSLSLSML